MFSLISQGKEDDEIIKTTTGNKKNLVNWVLHCVYS